jgi:uncharacterized protein (DUF58 family)
MMRRWWLLSMLIYGLVLLGLGVVQGPLLALAIPLVIYAGAALLDRPDVPQLSVTRSLSAERVSRGTPVVVKVSITNLGPRMATIQLEDRIPRHLELIEGRPRMLAAIAPGASLELAYTLKGKRGLYHFPGLVVTASNRLGLFHTQALLPAPGQLFIVPVVLRLRRIEIRPRRTHVYAGQIPARQGGPGVEFFGVREYQPGDPTRWINSRASARHPRTLFVNEFEQERVADVGLILDARAQSDVQANSGALFEHAILAAAALADAFLHRGNRVGLLMYGRALDWTFPGYGKVQHERILRALARAETGDLPVFEKLDNLPTRLFPARSQLVLISPLLAHDLDMLIHLRARRYQLLVISPDPIAFEQQALAPQPTVELAVRLARLERAQILHKCRQAGIPIVEWAIDVPFQQVAEAALSRPALWLRDIGSGP